MRFLSLSKLSLTKQLLLRSVVTVLPFLLTLSCSDDVILEEALNVPTSGYVSSGDIFIVSGGTVAQTATPYPLHQVTQWSKSGAYIRTLHATTNLTTFYRGIDLNPEGTALYFTQENVDRIEKIDLTTLVNTTEILDANLSGTTVRSMAVLSDGSYVVAESPTSIEKFTAAGVRVAVTFPLTIATSINNIKRISGGRFVVLTTGNPDQPRVYNNDGTLATTISGLGCTTNCDPYDIVELADGRFVVSVQTAAFQSLELFSSSFAFIGRLYKNTTHLINPGPLALMSNGNVLACTSTTNTCEEISISGSTGTRVGSQALISDSSLMRQPTAVVIAP